MNAISISPRFTRRPTGRMHHLGRAARSRHAPVLVSAALLMCALAGCDKEVTLVDPGPFFTFDPENAWPSFCAGSQGTGPAEPLPHRADKSEEPPGAPSDRPLTVPPPQGLIINACPNPAPPGTPEIVITFVLEVRRPAVNLGIVNDRGEIVARLLEGAPVEVDREVTVRWLLEGVPAGDYRAYFLAGDLETSGDLRVE